MTINLYKYNLNEEKEEYFLRDCVCRIDKNRKWMIEFKGYKTLMDNNLIELNNNSGNNYDK